MTRVCRRLCISFAATGSRQVGQMLEDGCAGHWSQGLAPKGLVLMDPVDGYDPYGIVTSENLIKPGQRLNFTIPTLLTRSGLDPKRANPFYPPCAPDNMSNDRFFYALRGPTWLLNATKFGHVDCLDPTGAISGGLVCASSGLFSDRKAYRSMLSGTVASFADLLFKSDGSSELPKLEDEELVSSIYGVDVTAAHAHHGTDPKRLTPTCSYSHP